MGNHQGARRLRWPLLHGGQQSLLALPNLDGTMGAAVAPSPTRAAAATPGLLLAGRATG